MNTSALRKFMVLPLVLSLVIFGLVLFLVPRIWTTQQFDWYLDALLPIMTNIISTMIVVIVVSFFSEFKKAESDEMAKKIADHVKGDVERKVDDCFNKIPMELIAGLFRTMNSPNTSSAPPVQSNSASDISSDASPPTVTKKRARVRKPKTTP